MVSDDRLLFGKGGATGQFSLEGKDPSDRYSPVVYSDYLNETLILSPVEVTQISPSPGAVSLLPDKS